MHIFIDESGSFQIPNSRDTHAAGVVIGVVVPEVCEQELFSAFTQFVSGLDQTERKNGEPKGARLSGEHKKVFADVLASVPGVMFLPTTIDLSDLAGHSEWMATRLPSRLLGAARECVHQTMRDQMVELSRQVANLSVQELLKLLLYAVCIQECIHHAVAYRSEPPYESCWSEVSIVIDRLNKGANSREKLVFRRILPMWLAAWSKTRPLMLINEVHTHEHAFIKNFDLGTGIDMGNLLSRVRWVDSADERGIQVADFVAAIVYSAVHDLQNQDDQIPAFLSLMRCCPLAARDGAGFISLSVPDNAEPQGDKYGSLVRHLESRFPHRAGAFKGLRQPPLWAIPESGRGGTEHL